MDFGAMPSKPVSSPIIFSRPKPRTISNDVFVQIYPNPTNGYINIKLGAAKTGYRFDLISMDGRQVHSQVIDGSSQKIDLSHLENGIYFYQIMNGDEVIRTDKLIILD